MDKTLQNAPLHVIILAYHTQAKLVGSKDIAMFQNHLKWC